MSEIRTTLQELEHLLKNKVEAWPNESLKDFAQNVIDMYDETGTLDANYFETATSICNLVNARVKK